jgi:signal transduction histidine kinase
MTSSWWWRALGGPSAVSWPILLIPIIIMIPTATLNAREWQMPTTQTVLGQVVGVAFMVATLVIARLTWLSPHRAATHRSALAAVTFLGASVMRLIGMAMTFAALGVIEDWPVVVSVLGGGIGQAILLCLGSIAVNALRGHARTIGRLESAGRRIAQARSLTLNEVRFVQREVADEVLTSARAVLDAARNESDARTVSALVQRAALDVVRPTSHSLNSGDAVADRVFSTDQKVRWRSVVSGVRPSAPVMGPLIYEVLVLGAVWGAFGAEVAGINLVLATSILVCANVLLARIRQRGLLSRWPLVWLAMSYTVANIVALAAVIVVTGALGDRTQGLVVGFALYPVAMLIGSVLLSVVERQSEVEQSLALAVDDEARAMAEALQLTEDERRRLARVMHGEVQAELTAAATRLALLEAGDRDGIGTVLDDLMQRLDQVDLSGSAGRTQTLADLWATWQLAVPLDVQVSAQAEMALASDSRAQQRLVAIASEAITNAVRHGVESVVVVKVFVEETCLELEVRNQGHLEVGSTGLGTSEIDRNADAWMIEQEGAEVVFTASVETAISVP